MKKRILVSALTLVVVAVAAVAADGGKKFQVTVTNLTKGQQFTPILVASHKAGVTLFTLGSPASPQLETLAEEGNTTPLKTLLASMPEVKDVTDSGGLLDPGATVTITVETGGAF